MIPARFVHLCGSYWTFLVSLLDPLFNVIKTIHRNGSHSNNYAMNKQQQQAVDCQPECETTIPQKSSSHTKFLHNMMLPNANIHRTHKPTCIRACKRTQTGVLMATSQTIFHFNSGQLSLAIPLWVPVQWVLATVSATTREETTISA